jgi:hypothetical protein
MAKTGTDLLREASDHIAGAKEEKLQAALGNPSARNPKGLDDAMTDADHARSPEKVVSPDMRESRGLPN